jgi:nitroimidazol reductase NimA-like FMN-containing flavoprotein (pyridoxamine 5'-phosphate oxidase superfamily)
MSENERYVEDTIGALFGTQKLAVLSTHEAGQPYSSLVAFVATEDLKHLYFATARNTRKYRNLDIDPRVSMLMDSRSNTNSDIHTTIAVTVTGTAAEVQGQEKNEVEGLYLSRHPYLRDFIGAESCALMRVAVETYYLVSHFQEVTKLDILP